MLRAIIGLVRKRAYLTSATCRLLSPLLRLCIDIIVRLQHKLSGPSAEAFLMQITPSALNSLNKYQSTLSCLLEDPSGGIVDDTVITRVGNQAFYFVTNAACRENDLTFLLAEMTKFRQTHAVTNENDLDWMVLEKHSLLALQGPKAASAVQPLIFIDEEDPEIQTDLSTLHFGNARYLQLKLPDGTNTPSLLISRTGYTGEDGFEMSIPPESGDSTELTTKIAEALLADPSTVRLAGLAARDSLRLEAGMCLYGHDIDLSTTPPEAGLGWTVGKERRGSDPTTANFNGSSKILEQLASPKSMQRRRVGLTVEKGPPAREGAEIVDLEGGDVVGRVTSGLPSPSLGGVNIAMGLVRNGWHKKGTRLGVRVRKNVRQAEVVKLPFVESKFYRG
jgi:aminomethyltransferase